MFPQEKLRSGNAQWKHYIRSEYPDGLPGELKKKVSKVRRRELNAVYAEERRQNRISLYDQQVQRIAFLEQTNAELVSENTAMKLALWHQQL